MKLAIGMPVLDHMPGVAFPHHMATVVEAYKGWSTDNDKLELITPIGSVPHDRARLLIAEEAIKRECTRLFFMDDDTLTPRGGIAKLMQTMTDRKAAIVTGFYLRRGYPYNTIWTNEMQDKTFLIDADQGVHQITSGGLGCCLVDLEWCCKNVPKPWFKMDQDESATVISDDVAFYRAVRKAEGLILGDADVQCAHVGRPEFICRGTATSLRRYADDLASLSKQERQ
jgi:hypothetical protein